MSNRIRNGGMYSNDEYIGKTLEEASEHAESGGFIVRITESNGQSIMTDMLDIKANRLNFRLKDGFVIDVYGG
jgi:hypothetical protein